MYEQDRWMTSEELLKREQLNNESFCEAFEDLMEFYRLWKDSGCKEFAGVQLRQYLKNLAEST